MVEKNNKSLDIMQSTDFDLIHNISPYNVVDTFDHYHDFYEIFIFLHGTVYFNIEGRRYDLSPGNILLINYHDVHQAFLSPSDYYERMYFWISPNYFLKHSTAKTDLSLCFTKVENTRSRLISTDLQQISYHLKTFTQLKKQTSYGSDIKLDNAFKDFLVFINESFLTQEDELTLTSVIKNELVEGCISYISDNLNQPLTIEEISDNLFVSSAHLARTFKKHTGFSLHQYILKRKLLYAKILLVEGKTVTEVYGLCGFSNYSHFIKAFKREFSVTPKKYQLHHYELDRESKQVMMERSGLS